MCTHCSKCMMAAFKRRLHALPGVACPHSLDAARLPILYNMLTDSFDSLPLTLG